MQNKIPAFIINRNLFTWTKKSYDFLKQFSYIEPYIIDNFSNYPPLLEWYKTIQNVILLNENNHHLVGWKLDIIKNITAELKSEYYLYTDPDLDIWNLPYDFVDKLKNGFSICNTVNKVGVHIKTDDLPINIPYISNLKLENYENNLLEYNLDNDYFYSKIDTTLALYQVLKNPEFNYSAIRVTGKYMCRHLPFYFTGNPNQIVEDCPFYEWLYYCENSNLNISNTSREFLKYYNKI